MAKKPTTRQMSDVHEQEIADLFGGLIMPGSGNQMANQMDVRQHHLRTGEWSFAFDGKCTLGESVGVSKKMWEKAVEQAEHEKPALPLRFFEDYRMKGGYHLVVTDANDLAGLIEAARKLDAVRATVQQVANGLLHEVIGNVYEEDGEDAAGWMLANKVLEIINA